MSDTAVLLSTLRKRNIKLWVEADRLRCSAPEGVLTAELRAELAARKQEIIALVRRADTLNRLPSAIVPIKPEGTRSPIFAVSGHGGDVFCFRTLARHLTGEHPVFSVRPPGLDGGEPLRTIEDLAGYEIEQIRNYRANGPYLIAGHCAGGTLAFEVAQQLTAAGQKVAFLALIGSPFPTSFRHAPQLLSRIGIHAKALTTGSLAMRTQYFMTKLHKRLGQSEELEAMNPTMAAARRRVENATLAALRIYKPRHYAGKIDLFVTADDWHQAHRWQGVAQTVSEHDLGDYPVNELMIGQSGAVLAASLGEALEAFSDVT